MFDIGFGEILLIVVAILVMFGPDKLPEFARMVGKGYGKIKDAQDTIKSQVSNLQKEMKFDADLDLNEILNDKKQNRRDQIVFSDFKQSQTDNSKIETNTENNESKDKE